MFLCRPGMGCEAGGTRLSRPFALHALWSDGTTDGTDARFARHRCTRITSLPYRSVSGEARICVIGGRFLPTTFTTEHTEAASRGTQNTLKAESLSLGSSVCSVSSVGRSVCSVVEPGEIGHAGARPSPMYRLSTGGTRGPTEYGRDKRVPPVSYPYEPYQNNKRCRRNPDNPVNPVFKLQK